MEKPPKSQNIPQPLQDAPADVVIKPEPGTLPAQKGSTTHGYHSDDAIRVPTSLTCSVCPLYHVKKRDKRHRLACKEGRKHRICPILTQLQQDWAFGLIAELRDTTGGEPTSSDNARIEQIVRHRSRIFQMENYLKVAGLIDLAKGEIRHVADRLTTTENSLSRSLSEFRQALSDRRESNKSAGPRLEDYLKQIQSKPEE